MPLGKTIDDLANLAFGCIVGMKDVIIVEVNQVLSY